MTDHILDVDISKANLDVHLVPTGETQQSANSTVGFRRLIAWLRERTATQNRHKQARLPLLKRQCASAAFEMLNSIPGISVITAIAVLSELPEIGSLNPKAAASSLAGPGAGHSAIRHPARAQLRPRGPAKAAPGALHAGCLSDCL